MKNNARNTTRIHQIAAFRHRFIHRFSGLLLFLALPLLLLALQYSLSSIETYTN